MSVVLSHEHEVSLAGNAPWAPATGNGFRLVPMERPGGGRIKDKMPPRPEDIVTVSGVGGKRVPLHRHAATAWSALLHAARADGIAAPLLLPVSGFRSPERQRRLWQRALQKYGSIQVARRWVAPPGGSPHQSGRAIDFYLGASNSSENAPPLRTLPAYRWLVANARRFGFYPYEREPWHWEYNPPARAALKETTPARQNVAGYSAFEAEATRRRRTWTRLFTPTDIERVRKTYQENASVATGDRASCIVMLNVALGQLLRLKLKTWPARGKSRRKVQMAALTTASIEKAMAQLQSEGFASAPMMIEFLDRRGRKAGTLEPERLQKSVQQAVLANTGSEVGWYAFGLSIMDGYHSVLLLVRRRAQDVNIFWLDQFSPDINVDVTQSLDQRIIDRTRLWWLYDTKRKGYKTTVRIWPLRKRVGGIRGIP